MTPPTPVEHGACSSALAERRSRAQQSRARARARAFWRGVRCVAGPPGLREELQSRHAAPPCTWLDCDGPLLPEEAPELHEGSQEDVEEEEDTPRSVSIGTGVLCQALPREVLPEVHQPQPHDANALPGLSPGQDFPCCDYCHVALDSDERESAFMLCSWCEERFPGDDFSELDYGPDEEEEEEGEEEWTESDEDAASYDGTNPLDYVYDSIAAEPVLNFGYLVRGAREHGLRKCDVRRALHMWEDKGVLQLAGEHVRRGRDWQEA